jgi:hypothetical protein
MGVYPVTLSLLAQLSLFGVDFGRGAPCDDRTEQTPKRQKPAIRGAKKKGSPE